MSRRQPVAGEYTPWVRESLTGKLAFRAALLTFAGVFYSTKNHAPLVKPRKDIVP